LILQPYIEHIILKGVKVARVGSSIKLHGHYFSQSILIKINDFETISNFMFIDSNNVEFTLARPSSVEIWWSKYFSQGLLPDDTCSNERQVMLDTFAIIVLGDLPRRAVRVL
jgi:hypothetical protein